MDGLKRPLVVLALVNILIIMFVSGFVFRKKPVVQQQPSMNEMQTPLESDCKLIDNKRYCTADYIDLVEKEATEKAQADGLTVRVVESDENPNIGITDDFQPKRINFTIKEKVVTKAEFY